MARLAPRALVLGLSLVLTVVALAAPAAPVQGQGGVVSLEWLGWNAWRATSPGGVVILLNPFVNNPDSVVRVDGITQADLILVTNGHGDEFGQTIEIAENTGATVVAPWGLGDWFRERGLPSSQVTNVNPAARVRGGGVTVRVLNGIHSADLLGRGTTRNPTSGVVVSYMITFENGWTLYYGGSSAATQDMALWARLYRPDAAILYLAVNTEPVDFAAAASLLMTDNPNLRTIFPGHHRFVQAAGTTTVVEAQEALNTMGVGLTITEPAPGQLFEFTK